MENNFYTTNIYNIRLFNQVKNQGLKLKKAEWMVYTMYKVLEKQYYKRERHHRHVLQQQKKFVKKKKKI